MKLCQEIKDKMITRFSYAMDKLIRVYDFQDVLDDFSNYTFHEWLDNRDYFEDDDNEFYIYYGISKMVIVFNDEDWVIKIPFCNKGDKENYCEIERKIYNVTKDFSLELQSLFAECDFLTEKYDLSCYIMERADADSDRVTSEYREISGEEYKNEEDEEDNYDCDSEDMVMEILNNTYSAKTMEEFSTFCATYQINDLHSSNIGFVDDRVLLIDYSGYHRKYWQYF